MNVLTNRLNKTLQVKSDTQKNKNAPAVIVTTHQFHINNSYLEHARFEFEVQAILRSQNEKIIFLHWRL